MARNTEKAMTALARWRAAYEDNKGEQERRPHLATECDDVKKSERWRRQIIGEVSRKVSQIQNAGLGEFKLRDLNDEINKLLREKGHWEDRILELGGPNYRKVGPRMLDHEGKEVPGNRGYKYFGAARDLPGVRELFELAPPEQPRKTRGELMKNVNADYYGYRDDDDGVLMPLEEHSEKEVIKKKVAEWKVKEKRLQRAKNRKPGAPPVDDDEEGEEEEEEEEDIYNPDRLQPESGSESETDPEKAHQKSAVPREKFVAHVPVPSQQEVEEALVRRRKQELMNKYASEVLQAEADKAKTLLGF